MKIERVAKQSTPTKVDRGILFTLVLLVVRSQINLVELSECLEVAQRSIRAHEVIRASQI